MKKTILVVICGLLALTAAAQKLVGGDISLLPSYEKNGARYLDKDGKLISGGLLPYLKAQGWNAARVRLFVDPSKAPDDHKAEGVRQDLAYILPLAQSIKSQGMAFMLDFHYSDTWTDPGKHSTPSAWSGKSVSEITTAIYDYTKDCLQRLSDAGAAPDYIQPGNEITYGMLWPTAHIWPAGGGQDGGTWDNFTGYLASAIKACREVCPEAKIVIQTEMSKSTNVTDFYATLAKYPAVDYDVIGLSYYPYHHGTLNTLNIELNTLEAAYPTKKIQIVETGYYHAYYPEKATYPVSTFSSWPATDAGQLQFTKDLITMLNKHPNVDGLYWWFPEANEYWLDWNTKRVTDAWYNAGLFDNSTGRAQQSLYELQTFRTDMTSGIGTPSRDAAEGSWYTLDGRRIDGRPAAKGVYVCGSRKVVVR